MPSPFPGMDPYVEAYKWVAVAWDRAPEDGQQKYGRLRDALEQKMTAEQLAEGRRRASDWLDGFRRQER